MAMEPDGGAMWRCACCWGHEHGVEAGYQVGARGVFLLELPELRRGGGEGWVDEMALENEGECDEGEVDQQRLECERAAAASDGENAG